METEASQPRIASVRLSHQELRQLDAVAERRKMTRSALLRAAVTSELHRAARELPQESRT
jgi:predicted transcriptional regulator